MTDELNINKLRAAIASINRRANLIVHPDDEATARDALDQLPEDVRPKLVVSKYLPGPGTAYFSRSVPIEHLTIENIPRGTFLDRDEVDDLAADIDAWGESYADDRTPLYLPSGELVAGERAAAYRRLRRRIAQRIDIEVHGESPPIDPLDLLAADHVHLEEE